MLEFAGLTGAAAACHGNCEAFLEEAHGEASTDDPAGVDLCHTGDRQP